MVTLGVETSCDETSVALVEGGESILASLISSQVELHQAYGGVVPELASRRHLTNLLPVLEETLRRASLGLAQVDTVAVTHAPGLVGALLVGVAAAKALAYALNKPLVAVHHIEAHIYANLLRPGPPAFPWVCLVASGGHSDLILVRSHGDYARLGRTRDDAAGEAFDKVARAFGLPYPGGPALERLAAQGDPSAVVLPVARLEEGSFDFSFSGLKTATLTRRGQYGDAHLAASFQLAVVTALVAKTVAAAKACRVGTVALAGGVAANDTLRSQLREVCKQEGMTVLIPPKELCTDNGAMVAAAGHHKRLAGKTADLHLNAVATLPLTGWAS